MADDDSKTSQTSVVFYVINVNDAPEMDSSILDGLALSRGATDRHTATNHRYR